MRTTLILGLVLLTAGAACAQIDPDPDGIGLYFDEEATQACASVAPFTQFDAYLCLTRPSSPNGASGFECRLVEPANVLRVYDSSNSLGKSVLSPPDYLVGLHAPLPAADVVVLLQLQFLNLQTTTRNEFFLAPIARPSLPGTACYADGADPRLLIPMHPSSGSWDLPVAVINGECDVVANEDSAWGRVKRLYGTDGEVSE
jgi:hypothetical protein